MRITSKSGTEITFEISGTQEDPIITAEKFTIAGNKVPSCEPRLLECMPGNPGTEAGLLFPRLRGKNVYVQCADEVPAIKAAIAELPHKEYWARKVNDTVDADGDICHITRWEFDKLCETEAGTIIGEERMEAYLDSKGITEIKIAGAVEMWADEKEAAYIKANEAGNARAKAIFEADEAEEGYDQACENAGIPKWMR